MHPDDDGTTSPTEEAIMAATYRALCEHGAAGLTMQAIADEFDKTKAVLHYHYDTKQQLLVAFLDFLLERFDRDVDVGRYDEPDERLTALLDSLLGAGDRPDDDEFDHLGITTALLQIRAQAPYDPEFSRQLTINATAVRDLLAAIIRDGIERGAFRDVDPERTAMLLLACVSGARTYEVTLDRDGVEAAVGEALERVVREWLMEPDAG